MCAEDRRTLFGCSKVFGIRHGALLADHSTLRRRTDFPVWPLFWGRRARRKEIFVFTHVLALCTTGHLEFERIVLLALLRQGP